MILVKGYDRNEVFYFWNMQLFTERMSTVCNFITLYVTSAFTVVIFEFDCRNVYFYVMKKVLVPYKITDITVLVVF